ncbi:MAG: N-acyl homoserine lactonase AiiA [Candidatus Erwinia impunctatus]|nr:N-acyl homoserine lactonase AiiA [Culicoides impunctatus]
MDNLLFFTRQVGDFHVTAVSDGTMTASFNVLNGIDISEAENIQHRAGIINANDIHINCYLIRSHGKTILIDTGTGGLNNAGGELTNNLRTVSVFPEDIDIILLTHAHPDHIGGLLDAQQRAVYKNAEIYLHTLEADYWLNDDEMCAANERVKRNFSLVRRTFDVYAEKLHRLTDKAVIPGITPRLLPGHTPGHTGFQVESKGNSLLIWGDIVHFPQIQSSHPDVSVIFDYNPLQAEATRKQIMTQVAREHTLIAGMNLAMPGFAWVNQEDTEFHIQYVD